MRRKRGVEELGEWDVAVSLGKGVEAG